MDTIQEIKYKNCVIKIYQDENAESPDTWEDDNLFLVGYHRDFCVKRDDIITEDEAKAILTGEIDDTTGYYTHNVKEIKRNYHTFGLEAYIHSGVVLYLSYEGNFPDRQWDVSQLGLVLVSKKETKSRKQARKLAEGLIKNWNDSLSGNVYGYIAEDEKNGKEINSCWGFYGDFEESEMIEQAKEEINSYIKTDKREAETKKEDFSKKTLGELLSSDDAILQRHALGILKHLQN